MLSVSLMMEREGETAWEMFWREKWKSCGGEKAWLRRESWAWMVESWEG